MSNRRWATVRWAEAPQRARVPFFRKFVFTSSMKTLLKNVSNESIKPAPPVIGNLMTQFGKPTLSTG